MRELRIDIVSDTHGLLTDELKHELVGADRIIHAGDICSTADFATLRSIAPVHLCLGNNDYVGQYGPDIKRMASFVIDGVRFQVAHYKDRLKPAGADVCVYGHTHRPSIEQAPVGGRLSRRVRPDLTSRFSADGMSAPSAAVADDGAAGALIINPGSATLPRTSLGPTIGRLWIRDGRVEDPQIVQLPLSDAQAHSPWFLSF